MRRPLLVLLCSLPLPAQEPAPPAAHWAFQPLAAPELPPCEPASIDRLVQAAREAAGLHGAARADARTLLRRASFVLTGLPPTPEELAAFAADDAPDAFARAVDRLLASPHYGEHQARAWLDLARYSDSNGLDENLAFAEAWRYRDWVVQACNDDLPFDRFGTLQLAGDLLAADGEAGLEGHVATGFLALGPKMLAEQDKEKLVLDVVDEQVDLVGRTFLGLTLGCARCHDHKFDPVPTRDYYALAGIFKSTSVFENLDHVSRWRERELAGDAELARRDAAERARADAERERDAARAAAIAAVRERVASDLDRALRVARDAAARATFVEAEAATATSLRRDDRRWGAADCVVLHTHRGGVQFAEWTIDVPAAGRYALHVRCAAQEARPMRVLVGGVEQAARALDGTTGGWLPKDQRWFAAGEVALAAGRNVLRLEALGPHVPHLDCLFVAPAAATVRAWPLVGADADGLVPEIVLRLAHALARGAHVPALDRAALQGPAGFLAVADDALLPFVAAADAERLRALDARCREAAAAVPARGPFAMCVAEGTPVDLPVHLRGSHLTLAPNAVPRGVLGVLDGAGVPAPAIPPGRSGRRELARWIFDDANPLTPRVLANRVWQQLFGAGLVRSPSNFGLRGEPPSHPGLLDLLAVSLLQDGWSVKRLQRRILLTATWQQGAAVDDAAAQRDPDDRLLWRWTPRRLPAESIRDAMLAVAGTLDRTIGGSLLRTKDRDYVTNDQSHDAARYDAPRRSLYLPIVRNAMYDLFTAFDYADPSVHLEQRPTSTVPSQALLLLNGPLALQQAAAFAAAAARAAAEPEARIAWIWQRALQREPDAAERAAARRWLARAPERGADDDLAWQGLCQAVFCTNEFVYVD